MSTLTLTTLAAQPGWNGMGGHAGWMWGMHWLWWVVWIGIAGGVIWALVSAVRDSGSNGTSRRPDRESPGEILRRRYAEGEIGREEFQEQLRVLRDDRGTEN